VATARIATESRPYKASSEIDREDFTTIGFDAVRELTTGFALSSLYWGCPRQFLESLEVIGFVDETAKSYERLEVIDFILVGCAMFRSDREKG
jgi:hypothetical protein